MSDLIDTGQKPHQYIRAQYQAVMEKAKDLNKIIWRCRQEGISSDGWEEEFHEMVHQAAIWGMLSNTSQVEKFTEVDFVRMMQECKPPQDMVDRIKHELNKFHEGNSSVVLVNGKDVKCKKYDWVILHWIVRNEFNLLAGVAKIGKTAIALKLAALITQGGLLAEKYPCKQGKVLIWSGEDDIERTIAPRLRAVDADMSKIKFIDKRCIIGGEDQSVPFYLDEDLKMLDQVLSNQKDVQMMVLDPIIGIAAKAKNEYSANQIRKALEPLIVMTRKHQIATLGITHFKKGGMGTVLDRVIGSQAWTAVARVVLVAGFLKLENTYTLCRAHCNMDGPINNIAYSLDRTDDRVLKIKFGRHMPSGVEAFEAQDSEKDLGHKALLEDASEFLLDHLKNIPGNRNDWGSIVKASEAYGLAEITLRRARTNLKKQGKIKSERDKGERGGRTLWYLVNHKQSDHDCE